MRIKEIAGTRMRYGYRRIHVLIKREGWKVNHKLVYRLYSEDGLMLRCKRKQRKVSASRVQLTSEIKGLNECWAMDFVSDQLYSSKRLRALS